MSIENYTANMTQLQAARIKNTLSKRFMYEGRPMTRAQIVEKNVSKGWTVENNDLDGRHLAAPGDDDAILAQDVITKTALDYAEFLVNAARYKADEKTA